MTAERRRGRKRARLLVPVVLILVAGLAYLAWWYLVLQGAVSTDDAYVDANPITVSTQRLGRVTTVVPDEGDTVSAGQILATLDTSTLEAETAQARTAVQVAHRSITLERTNLAQAQQDFERARTQFSRSVIPQEQFQHAQTALESARARLAMAQAQAEAAQAQVTVLESQLEQTRITSPSPGVVARKWVVPGDVVQPGQPILTVYDLSDVWITANFEETKLASIRLGAPAQVSLDAYSQTFKGRVAIIGAAAASRFALIPPSNASGNFTKVTQRVPVRIDLENAPLPSEDPHPRILPGMSATVRIRKSGGA